MAKVKEVIAPVPPAYILELSEEEAKFLVWVGDETRLYNRAHYTDKAKKYAQRISDALHRDAGVLYESAIDYDTTEFEEDK